MEKKGKRKLNIAMICAPIGGNKSGVVVSTLRFGKLSPIFIIAPKVPRGVKGAGINNGPETFSNPHHLAVK